MKKVAEFRTVLFFQFGKLLRFDLEFEFRSLPESMNLGLKI